MLKKISFYIPAKYTALAILAMLSLSLSACNTFEGMGRDIKSVGNTISGK